MSTPTKEEIKQLEDVASQVRRDIIRMVHGCGSGHPGGALGCADYLVALYFNIMTNNKDFSMDGENEDLFFLSNGHISAVQYSTLARAGYFDPSELATHRKINSRLQGHPATAKGLPGVRAASGSLGQGISMGLGAAQAKKLNGDDKLVHVLTGDGELQEGQIWEAAIYAAHAKVDNIIVTVDYNGQQIDGSVEDVMDLLNLKAKWEAFGWKVIELKEGNKMENVVGALLEAKAATGKGQPIVILMETDMGHPIDFMVGTHKWHGVAPNDDQAANALSQLEETLGDY